MIAERRGIEIESAVADGSQSMILHQVGYGIALRMAVMSMAMSGQMQQRQALALALHPSRLTGEPRP